MVLKNVSSLNEFYKVIEGIVQNECSFIYDFEFDNKIYCPTRFYNYKNRIDVVNLVPNISNV